MIPSTPMDTTSTPQIWRDKMPQAPIINMNGTSAQDLMDQNTDVVASLREARQKMREATPHGRDFQTDPDKYKVARLQYEGRMAQLDGLIESYHQIATRIYKQKSYIEGRQM
jgi:hypothetical protein